MSPHHCGPRIISGKTKALLLLLRALPAHSHTAWSHQPCGKHAAPQPCSQHELVWGQGRGDRYLYPTMKESSKVLRAGICLQISPH